MKSFRSLVQQGSVDFRYRLPTIFLSLVYGILISRALGTDGRGIFVLAILVVPAIIYAIVHLGLDISFKVAVGKKPKLTRIFHGDILFGSVVLGLISSVALALVRSTGFLGAIPILALPFVCLMIWTTLYQAFLFSLMDGAGWILERARHELGLALLHLVTGLFAMVFSGGDPMLWIVLFVSMNLVVSAFAFKTVMQKSGRPLFRISMHRYRRLFNYSSQVWGSELAARLRTQVDQILLVKIAGVDVLGIYNLALSLALRGMLPSQSLKTSSWKPIADAKPGDASRLVHRVLFLLIGTNAVVLVVGWLAAGLIPYIYGEDFRPAIPIFRALLTGVVALGVSSILPLYFFSTLNRPDIVLKFNWATLIGHFVVVAGLAGFTGILNAIIITNIIVPVIHLLMFYVWFRKYT